MKISKSLRSGFVLLGMLSFALAPFRADAAPRVSNLFTPLVGQVELSNGDVVNFSGQVHVVTRVTFSEAFLPAVQMYVNLDRVEGVSPTSGNTYLLVGASNTEWVGINPGPPEIPQQVFSFNLVEIQVNPGPPDLPPSPVIPVYLRDFSFIQEAGSEGTLTGVIASFESR